MPQEPQTLAFLIAKLSLFTTDQQMTSKFVKQWSKKIDLKLTNEKRALL